MSGRSARLRYQLPGKALQNEAGLFEQPPVVRIQGHHPRTLSQSGPQKGRKSDRPIKQGRRPCRVRYFQSDPPASSLWRH